MTETQNQCGGRDVRRKIARSAEDASITSPRRWFDVADVMATDICTIASSDSIAAAVKTMTQAGVSSILVVQGDKIEGIVTESDFTRHAAQEDFNLETKPVSRIMSSPVCTVAANVSVLDASQLMEDKGIKRLAVTRDDRLVGVISQTDLVEVLSSYGSWRDVCEIMSHDVVDVNNDSTVLDVARTMVAKRVSCVVIRDPDRQIAGIFTERDMLNKVIAVGLKPADTRIAAVMSTPVIHVTSDYSIFSASKHMEKCHIRRLVVMDEDKLLGIVTQTDILHAVTDKLEQEEREHLQRLDESESNIFTVDVNGNTDYVNPAFMQLLGVTDPTELTHKPFLSDEFWWEPSLRREFMNRLTDGAADRLEITLRTKAQQKRYVTVFAAFIRNVRNEVNGFQGVLHDITDRKRSQRKLERSFSLLHATLNSTADGICVTDNLRSIVHSNRKFAEMWYIPKSLFETADELILLDHMTSQLRDPGAFRGTAEELHEHPDREHFFNIEFRDGRFFECYSQPQYLQDDIVGRVWNYHDVTDRVENARKLESVAKLVDENPHPVLRILQGGRISYANNASTYLLDFWNCSVGQPCPGDVLSAVRKMLETGQDDYLIVSCPERTYSLLGAPVVDEGYVNLYGRDITELQKAQNAMLSLNEKLTRTVERLTLANIEMQDFAHVIAHDLKSPIRGIGTLATWLCEDLHADLDEKARKTISLLFNRAERLNKVLEGILRYSGIGRLDAGPETIDTNELVDEIISDLELPQNIKITVMDHMPTITCERSRISQVFHNILSNAIKYMDKPNGMIEVGCTPQDDRCCFYVRDNGPGIAPQHQEKIFELFETLHGFDTADSMGLGLALVKKIVDLSKGRVWLESEPGKGSTFFFTLPRTPTPSADHTYDKTLVTLE